MQNGILYLILLSVVALFVLPCVVEKPYYPLRSERVSETFEHFDEHPENLLNLTPILWSTGEIIVMEAYFFSVLVVLTYYSHLENHFLCNQACSDM